MADVGSFDLLRVDDLFTPEEREVRATVREFLAAEVAPRVPEWWETGTFPVPLVPKLGALGLFGANLAVATGSEPVSETAYGLIMYELERVDSGLRSFASVQGALVMYPIHRYGSDEQKARYLPKLASGEMIGCFGLTEHEGGSDPASMRTTARQDGADYVLNGTKMWITNGHLAQVALVWAKDQDGEVHGFLVPTDTPGFTAHPVKHKMSMRMSATSELVLQDVRVPATQMLPGVAGMRGPLSCLTQARYGIAWGALGALDAVYAEASRFAQHRVTFGKPIAARQLVQEKLVDMASDHAQGLLLVWRLGVLKQGGELTYPQVSLAKRTNVDAALRAARSARDIEGGSGITLEYSAIRHMLNLETVRTYEGTRDVHTLILGRYLTGHNALE